MMRRAGCSAAALLLYSASASHESLLLQPEALPEETCDGASGEECALSLRQLRVRELTQRVQEPEATNSTINISDDWPEGLALPGGWGEASDFAEEVEDKMNNSTAGMQSMSNWGGASCRRLGCSRNFLWWNPCQCNSDCQRYNSCCYDYNQVCRGYQDSRRRGAWHPSPPRRRTGGGGGGQRNLMTLYHQTGNAIGPLILRNGFRPGTRGWCGGGIYFATSARATFTKAIGPDSHKGFMIQAVVDVGRVKHMPKQCDRGMTGRKLSSWGYDSITFNPGDGDEYIVYSPSRVISTKQVPLYS